jgi:RimJ/RimL family protein N-acetyltransferase
MARAPDLAQRVSLPLETPRFFLRLPSARDVPELRRLFRDPLNARAEGAPLHSAPERRDPSLLVRRTRREFRRAEHLSLSVFERDSGACAGRVGLRGFDWRYRTVESLAYWVDRARWNRGYATEAAWFLCRAGFDRLGLRRIASQALAPNLRSQAVLRRLGFVEEGRERAAVRVAGRDLDMIRFGLLAPELRPWRAVRRSKADAGASDVMATATRARRPGRPPTSRSGA